MDQGNGATPAHFAAYDGASDARPQPDLAKDVLERQFPRLRQSSSCSPASGHIGVLRELMASRAAALLIRGPRKFPRKFPKGPLHLSLPHVGLRTQDLYALDHAGGSLLHHAASQDTVLKLGALPLASRQLAARATCLRFPCSWMKASTQDCRGECVAALLSSTS